MTRDSAAAAEKKRAKAALARGESGQGLVEYALIIVIVGIGSVLALGFLSGKIQTLFSKAGSSVDTVAVGAPGGGGSPPPPSPPPPPGPPPPPPSPPADGTPVNSSTPGGQGLPADAGATNGPLFSASSTGGPGTALDGLPSVLYDGSAAPPTSFTVQITQLGVTKTVPACSFTLSGYSFTGVWIRERGGNWNYGGNSFDWACISTGSLPAFAAPSNDTLLDGRSFNSQDAVAAWENANAGSPSGNPLGAWKSFDPGGTSPWFYFNGTAVWICTHSLSVTTYNFGPGGLNNLDWVCR